MAIDTQQRRAGAMLVGLPYRAPLVVPDTSVDDADRAQIAYLYSGLNYAGGGGGDVLGIEWLINARRRGSR